MIDLELQKQQKLSSRIGLALLALFLGILCVGCLIAAEAAFGKPSRTDWHAAIMDRIMHTVVIELFVAFLLFLALVFIWAVFRAAWVERALTYARDHCFHAMCLLLIGFGLIAGIGVLALVI